MSEKTPEQMQEDLSTVDNLDTIKKRQEKVEKILNEMIYGETYGKIIDLTRASNRKEEFEDIESQIYSSESGDLFPLLERRDEIERSVVEESSDENLKKDYRKMRILLNYHGELTERRMNIVSPKKR